MTKAKLFSHFHGVYKKNPYHDPKTGRFTFAPGGPASGRSGGSGSFTPAKSVEEAKAYATEKLGFKKVSYNYNYIDQETGRPVNGTFDLETINHINGTITEIQDRYPETKGYLSNLEGSWGPYSYYASIVHHSYDRDNPSLVISGPLYGKGMQNVKDHFAEDVRTGFHPKGTDYNAVLWHEYGHVYAFVKAKEKGIDVLDNARFSKLEKEWATEAAHAFDDYNRSHYKIYERPEDANNYWTGVSKYASKNHGELFAEAFSAYNTVDNPNMYIKELVRVSGADRK